MNLKIWLTKNIYVTSPRDTDSFFHPREYRESKEEVIRVVKETIGVLKGWKLEEYKENQGRIRASHRWIIGLGEEVNAYVVQGVDGITTLEITSHSLVGKGDWGQNRRNIKKLLAFLDFKIKSI